MNRKYIIAFVILPLLLLQSCKKYLQIQPEGAYTDDQVFASEPAAQQALNGLYVSMADNNLYGLSLTNSHLEIMAQRYKVTAGTQYYNAFQTYQYNTPQVQAVFDGIWQKAYSTILASNVFIANIEKAIVRRSVTEAHGRQMKAEAIAIRAMLHFDMQRLFAPSFTVGADRPAVPYYTIAAGTLQPILTNQEVTDKVLNDLSSAETLFDTDPVIDQGIVLSNDFYKGMRNQRMNYYAVRALKARVLLWSGKKQEAHAEATAVLSSSEKWFPWLTQGLSNAVNNPDRVFSPEIIFGLYNPRMYTNYTATFGPELPEGNGLAADQARLQNLFESNLNDYRYSSSWLVTTKAYPIFYKYADVTPSTTPWRFIQPMIRKSELYYILAETETNTSAAKAHLDAVRKYRNLAELPVNFVVATEIMKEYQKEFWGEGQLFYYYKRTNQARIPSGLNGTATVVPAYVVPLPVSETTPR